MLLHLPYPFQGTKLPSFNLHCFSSPTTSMLHTNLPASNSRSSQLLSHNFFWKKKKKVILVIFSLCLSQHFLGIDLKIEQVELGEKLLFSSSEGSAQVQEPIPQMTAQKNIPCFLPWHFNTSSLYFRRRNWHT